MQGIQTNTMKNFPRCFIFCGLSVGLLNFVISPAPAHEKRRVPVQDVKSPNYRNLRGQVVEIVKPARRGEPTAVVLDHENIPKFMPAMRMMFPLQNSADAGKLKKGVKIRFDLSAQGGNLMVARIKILPPQTKLKLAPRN